MATSRERKRVSGVVPTLSQPVLRFNLCWHNTGSAVQICPLLAPCCPQFKDEGGKNSPARQSTCPESFSSQWVKHPMSFLNQSAPSRLSSKLPCPALPCGASLLPSARAVFAPFPEHPVIPASGSALAVLFIPHFSITDAFRCQPKVLSSEDFPRMATFPLSDIPWQSTRT